MKKELLLELFSEEIPAFLQIKAKDAFYNIFKKHLDSNKISFTDLQILAEPRRIILYVEGLAEYIEEQKIEIKGPKLDAPDSAIEGFCRNHNIAKNDLTKFGNNYFYQKIESASKVSEILKKILPIAIMEYVWPKSMYWSDYNIKWIRPLRNILCIFGGEILDFTLNHIASNNITFGHKLLSDNRIISVKNFKDYKLELEKNYVILDREKRKKIIEQQLSELVNAMNLVVNLDQDLLEEVVGLVEYPNVMLGKINQKFLKLPKEVLVTSMKIHQKYFSLLDKNGNLAPYFLFVSNMIEDKDIIIAGNEKVLSARLEDALYFYHQDLLKPLESALLKLEKIIFHKDLGTIKDKIDRMILICKFLAPENKNLQISAKLCKSDLTSEMVGEFPELQGIMGYYYAINEKFDEEIATNISDHYKPKSQSDEVPVGSSAILAIADKADSLVGLILAGEEISASKDPYALRRQALGIIRIIISNSLRINLKDFIKFLEEIYKKQLTQTLKGNNILSFIEERVRFYLKNNYDVGLINSILDLSLNSDITLMVKKLQSLQSFLTSKNGDDFLAIYKRINNIIATKKITSEIDPKLFSSEYEINLLKKANDIEQDLNDKLSREDFDSSLQILFGIGNYINNFFDNIMINDEDSKIADNRLALLSKVKSLFNKIADFDKL